MTGAKTENSTIKTPVLTQKVELPVSKPQPPKLITTNLPKNEPPLSENLMYPNLDEDLNKSSYKNTDGISPLPA